jgi:hypothetical protein
MNNLKEQLRFRMLGQLSDEKTNIDINNAYDVAVDFAVSFTSFCAENYSLKFWDNANNKKWFCTKSGKDLTTEEILNKFLK